jgi:hypothetical protein
MKCTICSEIKKYPRILWEDIKRFGSPDFKKERWDMHFGYSLIISIALMIFMTLFMYLGDTPIAFQLFLGWFGLLIVNFLRELYMEEKYKAPFDWRDVRMGGYGGLVGSAIFIFIHHINLF